MADSATLVAAIVLWLAASREVDLILVLPTKVETSILGKVMFILHKQVLVLSGGNSWVEMSHVLLVHHVAALDQFLATLSIDGLLVLAVDHARLLLLNEVNDVHLVDVFVGCRRLVPW